MGLIYNPGGIYLGQTTAVSSYAANGWGLHDMIGNVEEWCQDWYGTYPAGIVTDPQGAVTGSYRVFRGGNWAFDSGIASGCRSAKRSGDTPDFRNSRVGFRVLLAPGQP